MRQIAAALLSLIVLAAQVPAVHAAAGDDAPLPTRPDFLKRGTAPEVRDPQNPWVAYGLWGLAGLMGAGMAVAVVHLFRSILAREKGDRSQ